MHEEPRCKDTLLAQLNNAYTCFQRSTGSLTEEDSSFTPVEGTFTVAGQVAHVGQTIDWFIEVAFRPDGFAMDFPPPHEQKIRAVASLAEAKDWIRRAVENARQVIESKNEEGWAAPLPPGQTVAAIVCGFALRFRSIEDLKNAQRADLGVLLGTAQAPTVLVLRQKIQTLVESVDPAALARACFQHYLALEPVSEGLYYADGHFCPYV